MSWGLTTQPQPPNEATNPPSLWCGSELPHHNAYLGGGGEQLTTGWCGSGSWHLHAAGFSWNSSGRGRLRHDSLRFPTVQGPLKEEPVTDRVDLRD